MKKEIDFNENWLFSKDKEHWKPVSLPHTWNNIDGMDGKGEYYRGKCFYQKRFTTPALQEGERVFIKVFACSLSGTVIINDCKKMTHEGGFSSFVCEITDSLKTAGEENTLIIEADNSPKSHIYPQMADFTFYGGLYRGVEMLILPNTHFDRCFHGADGLAVTPEVTDKASPKNSPAVIHLNTWIANPSGDFTVRYLIRDAKGQAIAESYRPSTDPKSDIFIEHPHLWQGVADPYLYRLSATLIYRNQYVDEVETRFGIRCFSVDPEKGFLLNGSPLMLRGVSRHQDCLWLGNALTKTQHFRDAELIKEVGANTVRLAHYQHSKYFYDACDEMGFIVWAEIPYISCQSDDPDAHKNCILQMEDLIYQNYNHPCICFWGISNEITIAGIKPGMAENHKELNTLVHNADPSRLTTIAHVSMLPMDSELHGITDLESYNHYFGWYGGSYEKNEEWLDEFHEKHPDICLGLSEYGAEGIITWQSDTPKCRDYSESYQALYHEHMVKILMERPYLWSTYVWNMFDFGCAARNEGGVAGRNNKGLVTMDRKIKKEAFYVYKAYWSREPFVHLCDRRHALRASENITVKIYSNLPTVTLYCNGKAVATQTGDKIFLFKQVSLKMGFNQLTAEGYRNDSARYTDSIMLERVEKEPDIYVLPSDDAEADGVTNWFEQVETVASDAPMEFSEHHYSIHDTMNALFENEETFRILSGALQSMTGMRLNKSMLAMMGSKTLAELMELFTGMGGETGTDKQIPANALQIINAELNKVRKVSHGPA